MDFKTSSSGDDSLKLVSCLQQFADNYWLPDHVTSDQATAMILNAFKRKVAGELELLDLQVEL